MTQRPYNLPPLNALKSFEAFSRHLNLRDAAQELCVTESAVSRQLKQLEGYLGVKLLERVGRNSQLTDVGQHYSRALSQGLYVMSEATERLFPPLTRYGFRQVLKIGVGPVFAEYWLSKRLGEFRALHPNIDLELHVNHNLLLEAPLERVDLEIYTGNATHNEFLCDRLFQIQDFAVCSPSLLKRIGHVTKVSELRKFPLLHEGSTHWWSEWFKSAGCQQQPAKHGPIVYDQIQCIKLALAGEGIALADHISTLDHIKNGELVRPTTHKLITAHWISLLIKPEKRQEAPVVAFRDWLLGSMQEFKSSLGDYHE
ncbi:LysR substrate-binding domain-containing protein [Shewanella amazonensis]|uniref:Transcriptional regulator, LysR family n=1 Tax=Shewanella amazonensis (strain ATCC BAA-1098 / SB2B) TaxID=326297 RepID=A1SBQ1_SHEAM|nr:LysR substrate-binding domain-containing protein [Shewanella amazonensis]ABM01808.1 transcriptional regulator, LysR family [Shewanella amazonensis SB2B]